MHKSDHNFSERTSIHSIEYEPTEIGLSGVDLKTQARTTGSILEVSGVGRFFLGLEYTFVGTTPLAGSLDIEIDVLSAENTLLRRAAVANLTDLTSGAGTYQAAISWGPAGTQVNGQDFTSGTTPHINFQVARRIRINANVATAFDQTGAKTLDKVWLIAA